MKLTKGVFLFILFAAFSNAKRLSDPKPEDNESRLFWGEDDEDNRPEFNRPGFVDDLFDWPDTWPDITDGIVDWQDLDWGRFDFENFDWDVVEWGNGAWEDFLEKVNLDETDINFCGILESAVGIGQAFGLAGDCECIGGMNSSLSIGCSFDDVCLPDFPICSSVDLNVTADTDGFWIETCFDIEDGMIATCLNWKSSFGQSILDRPLDSKACSVDYNGSPCACAFDEDDCLQLDCGMYLPGAYATTNQCGAIQMITAADAAKLVPKLELFDPNFTLSLEDLQNLEWPKVDWENFSIDQIDWENLNWPDLDFSDLLGTDWSIESGICPVLERLVGMTEAFGIAGGCTCKEGSSGSFDMSCSFSNECNDDNVCGSVDIDFSFDGIGVIETGVCVDFSNSGHERTCFSVGIPFADSSAPPVCSASYGGEECECSIAENFCLAVDCSEFEESATTGGFCQTLTMSDPSADSFIPRFSRLAIETPDDSGEAAPVGDAAATGGVPDGDLVGEAVQVGGETNQDPEGSAPVEDADGAQAGGAASAAVGQNLDGSTASAGAITRATLSAVATGLAVTTVALG